MTLSELKELSKDTLISNLGIKFTASEFGLVKATMPIDNRTQQIAGFLHGGATIALAETLASIGSYTLVDISKYYAFGANVNTHHLNPGRTQYVHGTAQIANRRSKSHLWDVKIYDDNDLLLSVSTILIVLKLKQSS